MQPTGRPKNNLLVNLAEEIREEESYNASIFRVHTHTYLIIRALSSSTPSFLEATKINQNIYLPLATNRKNPYTIRTIYARGIFKIRQVRQPAYYR